LGRGGAGGWARGASGTRRARGGTSSRPTEGARSTWDARRQASASRAVLARGAQHLTKVQATHERSTTSFVSRLRRDRRGVVVCEAWPSTRNAYHGLGFCSALVARWA
jgi:hypothetical protein